MASNLASAIGAKTSYSRVVSERDVLTFADLSGDHSPNHVDEAFMAATPYGRRIAHGALLVAFMSRSSTEIVDHCPALSAHHFPVSTGYDGIRFIRAVGMGDHIDVHYEIKTVDEAKRRTIADVAILNATGETCAVAKHIMTWIKK